MEEENRNQNRDQAQDNQNNQVVELIPPPPLPPPLPRFQFLAAITIPYFRANGTNLRDILQPLSDVLSDRPVTPQPQLRHGKRWRVEDHAGNIQAIEKALEEFQETPTNLENNEKENSEKDADCTSNNDLHKE